MTISVLSYLKIDIKFKEFIKGDMSLIIRKVLFLLICHDEMRWFNKKLSFATPGNIIKKNFHTYKDVTNI